MEIHLLRHTKPQIAEGVCYGQSDIGLSKSFAEELIVVKNKVAGIEFDGVFSSPLKRCIALAKSLCGEDMFLCLDGRLKEMNFGQWEMKEWTEIAEHEEARKWFRNYIETPCPGGECFVDLYKRVGEFINILKTQNQFENPLIVTHAGVIRAVNCIVKSKDLSEAFDLNVGFGELISFQV